MILRQALAQVRAHEAPTAAQPSPIVNLPDTLGGDELNRLRDSTRAARIAAADARGDGQTACMLRFVEAQRRAQQ